MNLAKITFF